MILRYLLIFLSIILVSNVCFAQLSPGKLAKSHSNLEGLSNCTKCHELGEKVSSKKCLECHKGLNSRIIKNKGYHVSKEVKIKNCISCHSDHHGLTFEMVRFDKKNFNHSLTGYDLKDKHVIEDCTKCHNDKNISDLGIKRLTRTYLGLETKCTSCHEDYHQKTLSEDCAKCHNYKGFKPAPSFNHDKTDFPLNGAHEKVKCESCHKKEIRSGYEFQFFNGVQHNSCANCHKDPHKGNFGNNCKSCHSEQNFKQLKSNAVFNHAVTGFELEGKHRSLDCKSCHDGRNRNSGVYKEFSTYKTIECQLCHEDQHQGKFGNKCEKCHNAVSFKVKIQNTSFDHNLTGFELSGRHKEVDCKKCHTSDDMTKPIMHDKCTSCHNDYHKGQFEKIKYPDCSICHDDEGFNKSTFDIDRHNETKFKLQGSHQAIACVECHLKDGWWTFQNIGDKCSECHNNIHEDKIDNKYMPLNDCTFCHDEGKWNSITFDHSKTNFLLEGKHKIIGCGPCHFKKENNKIIAQKFGGTEKKCSFCHENIHGKQFEIDNETDCSRCHGFSNWDKNDFNHDNTAFKLEGVHKNIDCIKCHPKINEGPKLVTFYKTGKIKCSDCHT